MATKAIVSQAVTDRWPNPPEAPEESRSLNSRGTLYLNAKGRRMYLEDSLEDGDTVFFMVGIAGG